MLSPGRTVLRGAMLAALLLLPVTAHGAPGPAYAVYLRLADGPAGSYGEMVGAMPRLAERAGMELLASYAAGTGACAYHATVFVLGAPDWAARVLATGVRAAFAAPLRLAVFEDEQGVHLALANPQSLARTIVGDEVEAPATEVVTALEAAVRDGFPGTPVSTPYGQLRDHGLIGRTMGIVAGGPFASKVERVATVQGTATLGVKQVADAIARAGGTPTTRWGLRLAYRYELPGVDGVLLGFTGDRMEAKSFAIVAEGLDHGRKGYACAGIDHAPAYPLELLVAREDGDVSVLLTDVMFRMKLYFEDAGTMKFAANMAMPGSIETELRDLVEEALENPLDRTAVR